MRSGRCRPARPGTGADRNAGKRRRALGATRKLLEAEARRIVDECYARAVEKLSENRDRLDRLAHALLEQETLDEADAYRVVGLRRAEEAAAGDRPALVGSATRRSAESAAELSSTGPGRRPR